MMGEHYDVHVHTAATRGDGEEICPCGKPIADCDYASDEAPDLSNVMGSMVFDFGGDYENRQVMKSLLMSVADTLSIVAQTAKIITEIADEELSETQDF